jgi:hypothetical protein
VKQAFYLSVVREMVENRDQGNKGDHLLEEENKSQQHAKKNENLYEWVSKQTELFEKDETKRIELKRLTEERCRSGETWEMARK